MFPYIVPGASRNAQSITVTVAGTTATNLLFLYVEREPKMNGAYQPMKEDHDG